MTTVASQEIVSAHSPDSDDAFMFYALATKKVRSPRVTFRHVLSDIETLNRKAMEGVYDLSAISYHAYPYVADKYVLMASWRGRRGRNFFRRRLSGTGLGLVGLSRGLVGFSEGRLFIHQAAEAAHAVLRRVGKLGLISLQVVPGENLPGGMGDELVAGSELTGQIDCGDCVGHLARSEEHTSELQSLRHL